MRNDQYFLIASNLGGHGIPPSTTLHFPITITTQVPGSPSVNLFQDYKKLLTGFPLTSLVNFIPVMSSYFNSLYLHLRPKHMN